MDSIANKMDSIANKMLNTHHPCHAPLILALFLAGLLVSLPAVAETSTPRDPSEELFSRKCASCHSVGKGKRVGPDLKNVHARRDASWLKRFIQSPSSMLDADPEARKLLQQYNGVRMPDLGLSAAQAADMVKLLERCSGKPCDLSPAFTPVTKANPQDFARGQALFLGTERMKNEAAPCVSCHTVSSIDGYFAGGTLAVDLTHVFARLGDEGMDAALRSPPFPVMNQIFRDHPLEEEEVFALRAFFYDANRRDAGDKDHLSFALFGVLGALVVLILLNAAWSRRLRGVREPLVHDRERRP